MRRIPVSVTGLLATMICLLCIAADTPKPAVAKQQVVVSEMRIQTMPPLTYLCATAETSFAKMGEPVQTAFDRVFGVAAEAKLLIARPTMLVYQGNPHLDPQKTFKMEIGIIVADETTLPDNAGDLKLRKTGVFKCASVLYTGPVDQQGKAYEKLIPAIREAGLTPTGEEREMCLYWESNESPNNVFLMQVGVK